MDTLFYYTCLINVALRSRELKIHFQVETIGDAYMVVSGAPMTEDNHAEKVCDMALDMVDAITDLKDPSTGNIFFLISIFLIHILLNLLIFLQYPLKANLISNKTAYIIHRVSSANPRGRAFRSSGSWYCRFEDAEVLFVR